MKILINGVIEVNEMFTSPEEIQDAVNKLLQDQFSCNYLKGGVDAIQAASDSTITEPQKQEA
jgi:hypothetical protein